MADTPFNPTPSHYQKGLRLDQVGIVGRRRKAGSANIPDGNVDLLNVNERGELIVARLEDVAVTLEKLNLTMQELVEALASLR